MEKTNFYTEEGKLSEEMLEALNEYELNLKEFLLREGAFTEQELRKIGEAST